MTLRERRCLFTKLAASLIGEMEARGYEAAFNEVGRSDEQSVINSIREVGRSRVALLVESEFPALALAVANNGKANGILFSVHRDKCAVDVDLYRDGVYLRLTSDHEPFGLWWESQHPLCRWGGRWGDGNHYSIEVDGRK